MSHRVGRDTREAAAGTAHLTPRRAAKAVGCAKRASDDAGFGVGEVRGLDDAAAVREVGRVRGQDDLGGSAWGLADLRRSKTTDGVDPAREFGERVGGAGDAGAPSPGRGGVADGVVEEAAVASENKLRKRAGAKREA